MDWFVKMCIEIDDGYLYVIGGSFIYVCVIGLYRNRFEVFLKYINFLVLVIGVFVLWGKKLSGGNFCYFLVMWLYLKNMLNKLFFFCLLFFDV